MIVLIIIKSLLLIKVNAVRCVVFFNGNYDCIGVSFILNGLECNFFNFKEQFFWTRCLLTIYLKQRTIT